MYLHRHMTAQFEELIEGFITNKIGISDVFLAAPLALLLQKNLQQLHADGEMHLAGIGNAVVSDPLQKLRGDKIYWLDKKNRNAGQMEFLDMVDQLIDHLNSTCYTGINACEFHYAFYETGSFYKRHKDQFRNDSDRKYSLVSYLNDDWLVTDGGELVVYQNGGAQKIEPAIRKAVFFQSNEMEHEVRAATRPRMSVTGWLKRV